MRNSKILEILKILSEFEIEISVFDPYIDKLKIPNINTLNNLKGIKNNFGVICICVEHDFFATEEWNNFIDKNLLRSKIISLKNL